MKNKAILFFLTTVIGMMLIVVSCYEKKQVDSQERRDYMIVDKLEKGESYYHMHQDFKKVFSFLREKDLSNLPLGKHEIDGDRLFYIVQKEPGRNKSESKLEAHRKYIDIQYIIAGSDEMGWRPISECEIVDVPYDENKDIGFFNDEPKSWTKVPAGSFTIFFPQDAHAPMISAGEIHKIVFKVAVER